MNDSLTIETPGGEKIYTTLDAMKRATAQMERAKPAAPPTSFAKDQLKSIVERVERLEEEKKSLTDDIRDIYAEAKGNGFDVKALRAIVRLRRKDPNQRQEEETILETYMQALGML